MWQKTAWCIIAARENEVLGSELEGSSRRNAVSLTVCIALRLKVPGGGCIEVYLLVEDRYKGG